MATQLPTSADVLLLALQAQVILKLNLAYETVPLITDDGDDAEALIAQAETMAFLAWGDSVFDAGHTDNAGRIAIIEKPVVQARLWTRLNLDESTRDDVRLTAPSTATPPGHLYQRHQLVNALALFQPVDKFGNWLVTEPMKPLRTGRPVKPKGRPGWTRSTVDFVCPYQLTLDQSYQ